MKIKITRKHIDRIVDEILSKKEAERRRKKRIMGYDSSEHIEDEYLKALGRGIVKEKCVGNAAHGQDGQFVDPDEESGSYSLPRGKGCERRTGQYKRKGRKDLSDREPCGRKSPTRKLCKEDKKQSGKMTMKGLEDLIRSTIQDELKKRVHNNPCTTNDLLWFMDRVSDAEKGKLGEKG